VAGATLDNGGFPISGSATLTVVDGGTLQLWNKYISCFNTTVLGITESRYGTKCVCELWRDLLLSGSGNKTFAGVTTIAGDLVISDTAVACYLIIQDQVHFNSGNLQTTLGSYGGTSSTATVTNGTWFGSTTTGTINVSSSCIAGTWLGIDTVGTMLPTGVMVLFHLQLVTLLLDRANQPTIGAGGFCKKPHY
jgi:hypothetical protein